MNIQRWDESTPNITLGNFVTEDQSHDEFSRLVDATRCFRMWHEVTAKKIGELPHWRIDKSKMRVDFILQPTERLISHGWPAEDWIIVECKKSGIAIGPAVSQLIDYVRCEFEIDGQPIRPTWGFVWPAAKQAHAIASVMAHQHVGTVSTEKLRRPGYSIPRADFHCGESRMMTIEQERVDVLVDNLRIGRKSGSR